MSLASLYGGYCLGPVNTTAGHAVAYPLGTRHHIAHGLACAVIFPHTLAFNMPATSAKTAAVLQALGLPERKTVAFDSAYRFCTSLGSAFANCGGVANNNNSGRPTGYYSVSRLYRTQSAS